MIHQDPPSDPRHVDRARDTEKVVFGETRPRPAHRGSGVFAEFHVRYPVTADSLREQFEAERSPRFRPGQRDMGRTRKK